MDETSAIPAGDAELVRRIRAGDERALEIVFRAHYAGMASFVQRFVRSPDLAEELVQDVFLKLWSKREHLAEIETFRTYLFRAARNTALNYLRRVKLERRWQEEQGGESDPPATFAADEETAEQEVAATLSRNLSAQQGRRPDVRRNRQVARYLRQDGRNADGPGVEVAARVASPFPRMTRRGETGAYHGLWRVRVGTVSPCLFQRGTSGADTVVRRTRAVATGEKVRMFGGAE